MYCKNFVEDFTNKLIDKISCPCGFNNYTHYDMALCQMIQIFAKDGNWGDGGYNDGYHDDGCYKYTHIYINCLVTYLHNREFNRFIDMLKDIEDDLSVEDMESKLREVIEGHLNCAWAKDFNVEIFNNRSHIDLKRFF